LDYFWKEPFQVLKVKVGFWPNLIFVPGLPPTKRLWIGLGREKFLRGKGILGQKLGPGFLGLKG